MRHVSLAALGLAALAATASAATHKTAWASGTIGRVDTTARSVVVTQGTHEMTFNLASDATLMQGRTTIQAADLASDIGRHVKVRYSMNGTTKIADRLEVAASVKASATSKKK